MPDIWLGMSGDVQGPEELPARQAGYRPSAMPRRVPHSLVQTHVRRVFNQVLGTAIDHVYGGTHTHALGDMVGIRLVNRVAVPYETEGGQSRHAASRLMREESIAVARGARYNSKIKLVAPLARYFMET